jgi:hypothetical protein
MLVSPVFAEQPHVRCEVGPLAAWFTEPSGVVLQLTEAVVFTLAMARWVGGEGYAALAAHFPGNMKVSLLLDLRPMTAREAAARGVMMEAGQKYLQRFSSVVVVPPIKPPPLYMTTLIGAAALLSAIGPEITIVDSLDQALERLEFRPEALVQAAAAV